MKITSNRASNQAFRARLDSLTHTPATRMTQCQSGAVKAISPSAGFDALDLGWHVKWTQKGPLWEVLKTSREGTIDLANVRYGFTRRRPAEWNGQDMQYFLVRAPLLFGISVPADPRAFPGFSMQARGMACLTYSVMQLHGIALDIISALGGELLDEVVNRVDVRVDLPEQPLKPFIDAHRNRRYVSKSHTFNLQSGRSGFRSLRCGGLKASTSLLIYNKLTEARGNPDRLEMTRLHCWEGSIPSTATRVEFRLYGRSLRTHNIKSFHDLISHRSQLVRYLSNQWFRLTTKPSGNRHAAPVDPLWKTIQCALDDWASRELPVENATTFRQSPPRSEARALVRCAIGLLEAAAATIGRHVKTQGDVRDFCIEMFDWTIDGKSVERIRAKCASKGLTKPISATLRAKLLKQRSEFPAPPD